MTRLRRAAIVAAFLAVPFALDVRAALPASDDCSSSLFGTSWTVVAGTWGVTGGVCRPTADADDYNIVKWTADSFNANHYAQSISPVDSGYGGPCVRMTGATRGAFDGYCLMRRAAENNTRVLRFDDGVPSALGADFGDVTDSTVMRLEVDGTTLTIKFDGVSQGTRTDATYDGTSSAAGEFVYSIAGAQFDNFQADNVGGGAATCTGGLLLLGAGRC